MSRQVTGELRAHINYGLRFLHAARAINMNEKERAIAACLLIDPNPWPVQTMADTLGYSRAAIRKALIDAKLMGLARETTRGWEITSTGAVVLQAVTQELFDIAAGRSNRFSPEVVRMLRDLPTDGVSRPFTVPSGRIV